MSQFEKLLLLRGTSDANFAFDDLTLILEKLGFGPRIRGSHHIYSRDDIPELLNLQRSGKNAKKYQVRDVRELDRPIPPRGRTG